VTYLTQSIMAEDIYMRMRVASCAAGEGAWEVGINPDDWTRDWKRVWSTGSGWDTKWEEAMARGDNPPDYAAGSDPEVVTDEMIKTQVELMKPFHMIEENKTELNPQAVASREFVQMHTQPMNDTIFALKKAIEEAIGKEITVRPSIQQEPLMIPKAITKHRTD